jgi:quercetin dioxygenase-like cupin family protein
MNYQAEFEEIAPNVYRKLAYLNNLTMAVIDITNGPMEAPDPYHSHVNEQITYVAEGKLKFFIEDDEYELQEGDVITVACNKKHTIQTLSSRVRLIDSFSPVREDFIKK